jgi:hypothetical protein
MSRVPGTLLTSALALSLSACVLVPVDSHTGLPVQGHAPTTVIVQPPAASPASASVLTARLYPLNEPAQRAGMLSAVIVDHRTGRGTITLGYLGDTLQGEATRVDGSGRRGVANATGPRGVSAQCSYELSGAGMGTGSCSFTDGAQYRLHFGG